MSSPTKGSLYQSFRCALLGFWDALQSERNMRVHFAMAVVVLVSAAWLRLTRIEWLLILAAIGLVFVVEMFNTVVEVIVDLVTEEQLPLAKRAKDIAAGAVFAAALTAASIGAVILGPRMWLRIEQLVH